MTPVYANETTPVTGTGTSAVVGKPASTASGDLLIAAVNTGSGATGFTAPSGWTAIAGAPWTDSNDTAGGVWWKVAGGSEPTTYTWSWTNSGDYCATIKRVTGAPATSPIRTGARHDQASGTGASFASTALSGTQATDLTMVIAQMGDDNGVTTFTVTNPSSPWTTIDNFKPSGSPKFQGASYAAGSQSGASFTSTSSTAFWNITSFAIVASGTTQSGTTTLAGSGTLTGAGVFAAGAALSGSGTLTAGGADLKRGAALSGSGTLTASRRGLRTVSIALDGSGTLAGTGTAAVFGQAALSGSGTLSLHATLGYPDTLTGIGTINLRSTGQAVFASPGASASYAYPGTSQVSVAPPGSSSWQYLGQLGDVTALKYSFTCPGGADKMSCTLMVPAAYRTQLLNPGWKVRITRGGHQVWAGKLDEPVPTAQGWNLTAVGDGNRGADFLAVFSATWPVSQPDQSINNAISRGLPWVNPGVGTPSGAWFGQAVDSAASTIKSLLDLVCTRGALTWYVNSQPGGPVGSSLSVFPLPTAVNRLIVCTQPVARTLGGDINTIYIRYQVTDSSTAGTTATYAQTSVQNVASAQQHGVLETYIDLSNAGVMSSSAAQAVGNSVLAIYQRASFAGPFTGSYGQLLTTGGQPIDPGTDQAGTMARLILTDYGYGGEVTPQFPITFIVGAYEWDDFAQIFTATPYQNVDQSLTGLLSIRSTTLTPIKVA